MFTADQFIENETEEMIALLAVQAYRNRIKNINAAPETRMLKIHDEKGNPFHVYVVTSDQPIHPTIPQLYQQFKGYNQGDYNPNTGQFEKCGLYRDVPTYTSTGTYRPSVVGATTFPQALYGSTNGPDFLNGPNGPIKVIYT